MYQSLLHRNDTLRESPKLAEGRRGVTKWTFAFEVLIPVWVSFMYFSFHSSFRSRNAHFCFFFFSSLHLRKESDIRTPSFIFSFVSLFLPFFLLYSFLLSIFHSHFTLLFFSLVLYSSLFFSYRFAVLRFHPHKDTQRAGDWKDSLTPSDSAANTLKLLRKRIKNITK